MIHENKKRNKKIKKRVKKLLTSIVCFSIMVNASEDKHVKRSNHMENINSEKYSRGRRGAPAKGVGRETGARVQIPLSPLFFPDEACYENSKK